MRRAAGFIFIFVFFLIPGSLTLTLAVEEGSGYEYGGAIPEEQRSPQMQWVWGRALSVDPEAGIFTISYLDYVTDQSKELVIAVNNETVYEHIESISEIKASDTLSVDFVIDAEGRNIASNVSVDKTAVSSP